MCVGVCFCVLGVHWLSFAASGVCLVCWVSIVICTGFLYVGVSFCVLGVHWLSFA